MKKPVVAHRCPRCREYTDEVCYCKPCQTVLKRPHLMVASIPYHNNSLLWR
jgi:hypothetical protein